MHSCLCDCAAIEGALADGARRGSVIASERVYVGLGTPSSPRMERLKCRANVSDGDSGWQGVGWVSVCHLRCVALIVGRCRPKNCSSALYRV
jgi:hypothetical protein